MPLKNDGWFDWSKAAPMEAQTVEKWIADLVSDLKGCDPGDYRMISCGDTVVFARKEHIDDEGNGITVKVMRPIRSKFFDL